VGAEQIARTVGRAGASRQTGVHFAGVDPDRARAVTSDEHREEQTSKRRRHGLDPSTSSFAVLVSNVPEIQTAAGTLEIGFVARMGTPEFDGD